MNKYTLKFTNSKLEDNYSVQSQNLKYELLVLFNIIVILIGLSQFHLAYVNSDNMRFVIQGIICSHCLLNIPICYYHKDWSERSLIFLNHLILFVQLTTTSESQDFMYGTGLMMGHTVIFIVCDFDKAAIQLITILTVKICIWIYKDNDPEFSIFIAMTCLFLLEIFCLYKVGIQRRQMYLLTLKDNSYIQILQSLIKESFVFFHYNPCNLSFILDGSTSHIQCQSDLTQFLRESMIHQQTLENYIFYHKDQNFNNQEELILYNKKLILIEHSQITTTQLSILIIFKNSNQVISLDQYKNKTKNIYQKFLVYIKAQTKQICKGLRQKQISIFYQQCLLNYQMMLNIQIKYEKPQLKSIYLYSIIKKISWLFHHKNIGISIDENIQELYSIKEYFIALFIHFFSSYQGQRIIVACQQNDQNELMIQFNGDSYYETNKLNEKVITALIKDQNENYNLNWTSISIICHKDPQITFI